MTSNSPKSAPAACSFKASSLTLEAAAFVTIFLGLVYLFARSCRACSAQRRRKDEIKEGSSTQRVTDFLISENQKF
ncbi:MAG: hypothetical protein ABSA85_12250 [Terracidiphilus sp.]|jgi:hypothetical protein